MTDLEPIIRRDLDTIAHYWQQLLDLPRELTEHTIGRHEAPPPLPTNVVSLRFDTAYLLASWAHLVWDEMHLTTGLDLLATVPICRFLDRHSRFLADHYIGKYAVSEIGYLADQIVELVTQTKPRRIWVGKCPDCEGNLIAYIHIDSVPSDLRCTANTEHVWDQTRWLFLGNRITA